MVTMLGKNVRFVAVSAGEGSNSYHVMARGLLNKFGDPYCVEPYALPKWAMELADKLNKMTAEQVLEGGYVTPEDFEPFPPPLFYPCIYNNKTHRVDLIVGEVMIEQDARHFLRERYSDEWLNGEAFPVSLDTHPWQKVVDETEYALYTK